MVVFAPAPTATGQLPYATVYVIDPPGIAPPSASRRPVPSANTARCPAVAPAGPFTSPDMDGAYCIAGGVMFPSPHDTVSLNWIIVPDLINTPGLMRCGGFLPLNRSV